MPFSFSDLTQLVSLALAFAALGVAVDGVMVPRLEKIRDRLLEDGSRIADDGDLLDDLRANAKSASGSGAHTYTTLEARFEKLKTARDDLKTKYFHIELSSLLFFNGSIVRVFLFTVLFSVSLLSLSVFTESYFSSHEGVEVAQKLPVISGVFDISNQIGCATFLLVYLSICFVVYIFKWRSQLIALKEVERDVQTELDLLAISKNLLYQRRAGG